MAKHARSRSRALFKIRPPWEPRFRRGLCGLVSPSHFGGPGEARGDAAISVLTAWGPLPWSKGYAATAMLRVGRT